MEVKPKNVTVRVPRKKPEEPQQTKEDVIRRLTKLVEGKPKDEV